MSIKLNTYNEEVDLSVDADGRIYMVLDSKDINGGVIISPDEARRVAQKLTRLADTVEEEF